MTRPSSPVDLGDDPSNDPALVAAARELGRPGEVAFLLDFADAASSLVPNPPMRIEDWAPKNAFIPASKTTRGGPARLTPVQRGLGRLLQQPGTDVLIDIKCPRLGITTFGTLCGGYYAGWEQSDVLVYERSKPTAQVYSKDKLMPIMRASPGLKVLLRPDGKTGEQDTWDNRELMNGASIKLRSVENEDSFKGIRGRLIICEEAGDAAWQSGGANAREGSKLDLAMRRGQEYADGKVFLSGTPTIKGSCLISEQWELSRQHLFRMPCPHCGARQEFAPDVRHALDPSLRYGPGLRYSKDAAGVPDVCWYECANPDCTSPGGRIEEVHKSAMMEAGDFDLVREGEPGKVGTYIWMAYSEDPKATWLDCAKEHDRGWVRGSEEQRKAFVTMFLAQAWDPAPAVAVNPSILMERVVDLGPGVDCPADTVFLVAAVDNQEGRGKDDPDHPARGEITVLAVRENGRLHVVRHDWLHHLEYVTRLGEAKVATYDPFSEEYADAVYAVLDRDYVTADGRKLRPRATFVDCGWQTELAWRFATSPTSKSLSIWPIRGDVTERANRRVPLLPTGGKLKRSKKSGRSYLWVGTRDAKDECSRRLAIPDPAPYSITFSPSLEERYFRGLLAERLVEVKTGLKIWTRISSSETGEPWDCLQYAYAAAELVMTRNKRLREQVYRIDPLVAEAALAAQVAAAAPVAPTDEDDAEGDSQPAPAPVQPADEITTASGLKIRKVRRVETTPDVAARIDRIRRRSSRSGIGW